MQDWGPALVPCLMLALCGVVDPWGPRGVAVRSFTREVLITAALGDHLPDSYARDTLAPTSGPWPLNPLVQPCFLLFSQGSRHVVAVC